MTGWRFVDWLHATVSALRLRGYTSGVVSCFSINEPSTRASSG
jgi:hypothetical protein